MDLKIKPIQLVCQDNKIFSLMSDGSICMSKTGYENLEWTVENSPIELFNEPNDKPKEQL